MATARQYKLRPLLFVYKLPRGLEMSQLLPYGMSTIDKEHLGVDHSWRCRGEWIFKNGSIMSDIFNLSYIECATIYHCKRLAHVYTDVCLEYAQSHIKDKKIFDFYMFGNQKEVYYEFVFRGHNTNY